ncbi:MAG: hypothetical protein WBX11_12325 [Thiobacillaceae bacterium]|jgi:hypothetical protein
MKVTTAQCRETNLNFESLAALKMRLKGRVLRMDDVGHMDSGAAWIATTNKSFALLIRCPESAVEIAAVLFAPFFTILNFSTDQTNRKAILLARKESSYAAFSY